MAKMHWTTPTSCKKSWDVELRSVCRVGSGCCYCAVVGTAAEDLPLDAMEQSVQLSSSSLICYGMEILTLAKV